MFKKSCLFDFVFIYYKYKKKLQSYAIAVVNVQDVNCQQQSLGKGCLTTCADTSCE